jgi:outer membrane protein assembly factor BamB
MNKTVTVLLAVVLMVIVMTISVILFFTGAAARVKWEFQEVWTAPFSGAESMKIIDLTGDKAKDVFLQSQSEVAILDAQGQEIWSGTYQAPATTMGDFNGDGTDDFVVIYQPSGESMTAVTYTGQGQELWTRALPNFGEPSRATSVDFLRDEVREIVTGDMNGHLVCLSSQGEILWEYDLPNPTSNLADSYVRGLDDVALGGTTAVAAANYAGQVVLLDGQGQPLWGPEKFPERLRRLRAYDLDGDGSSEVVL